MESVAAGGDDLAQFLVREVVGVVTVRKACDVRGDDLSEGREDLPGTAASGVVAVQEQYEGLGADKKRPLGWGGVTAEERHGGQSELREAEDTPWAFYDDEGSAKVLAHLVDVGRPAASGNDTAMSAKSGGQVRQSAMGCSARQN